MNTARRATRPIVVVTGAVMIAVIAVLVVPGLAGARDGDLASNVPEPAPGTTEPAVGSVSIDPVPAAGPTEPAQSTEPDPGPRSGAHVGPPPPPVVPRTPAPAASRPENPDTAVSSPALPYDPNYWTPERMANAKPMPMPTVP